MNRNVEEGRVDRGERPSLEGALEIFNMEKE
jgi:hypothetical protein